MRRALRTLPLWAILGCLSGAGVAVAHEGPPYPIIVDHPVGTMLLSVWADPDVGTGTFHVYLERSGDARALPEEVEVEIFVRPVSERLPERGWEAEPFRIDEDRLHYVAEVAFDAQELWTTRIVVAGGGNVGEASTVVEVTPPGQGPVLDFVLYLFPFAAVGFLVVRALLIAGRRGRATTTR